MSVDPDQTAPLFDDPAGSVAYAIEEALAIDETLPLAVITDEELYAYCSSAEEAAPEGAYFHELSQEQRHAASVSAMRVLAAHGRLGNQVDEDGAGTFELPTATVAALELRKRAPQLSLQLRGQFGEAWYILRHVQGELFLRESVTPQGFHTHTLVRLDEQEQEVFIAHHQLPDGAEDAAPPHVQQTVTLAQVEGASIGTTSTLDFLRDTTLIGTLVRVPEGDGPTTTIVNVQPGGGMILGDLVGEAVRYRGGSVADLREAWGSWVPRMQAAVEEYRPDDAAAPSED